MLVALGAIGLMLFCVTTEDAVSAVPVTPFTPLCRLADTVTVAQAPSQHRLS